MQAYNCGHPRAILSRPVWKSRLSWLLTRKSGRWRRTQRWQRQASCLADRRTKSGASCSLLRPISLAKGCPTPRWRRQWTSFLFRKHGRSSRRKRSFISVFPVNKVVDHRYRPIFDWRISIAHERIASVERYAFTRMGRTLTDARTCGVDNFSSLKTIIINPTRRKAMERN